MPMAGRATAPAAGEAATQDEQDPTTRATLKVDLLEAGCPKDLVRHLEQQGFSLHSALTKLTIERWSVDELAAATGFRGPAAPPPSTSAPAGPAPQVHYDEREYESWQNGGPPPTPRHGAPPGLDEHDQQAPAHDRGTSVGEKIRQARERVGEALDAWGDQIGDARKSKPAPARPAARKPNPNAAIPRYWFSAIVLERGIPAPEDWWDEFKVNYTATWVFRLIWLVNAFFTVTGTMWLATVLQLPWELGLGIGVGLHLGFSSAEYLLWRPGTGFGTRVFCALLMFVDALFTMQGLIAFLEVRARELLGTLPRALWEMEELLQWLWSLRSEARLPAPEWWPQFLVLLAVAVTIAILAEPMHRLFNRKYQLTMDARFGRT